MSECYSFVVNGVPCSTEEEKPLLRYLRDELRLTSVKDGCSEGACGTCTILVDGKAVKACVLSTKRAAGKEIVTVEGLSEAEREAFVYAFGAVGAVQCGFCIPGMVMAGKALLDQNPNPTEAEIKKAIRGNVCRCTGYKKIIEGIALAGAILRGEASVDPALEEGEDYGVGARAFRTDVRDKVLGRGEYCDDLYLDGMAHASAVRSQYPRARVLDIDASAALALPGVLAVLTADDVPHNKVGHLQQDWDVMIAKGDITRCVGDAVCLVVAENEAVLKQAKELVDGLSQNKRQYSTPVLLLGYVVAAGFFAAFFNGGVLDAVSAGICGLGVGFWMLYLGGKMGFNGFFQTLIGAAIASLLALLLTRIGVGENVDAITIGTLMVLVPGMALTNAMREIMAGDIISGVNRTAEAILTAAAISLGVVISLAIGM